MDSYHKWKVQYEHPNYENYAGSPSARLVNLAKIVNLTGRIGISYIVIMST